MSGVLFKGVGKHFGADVWGVRDFNLEIGNGEFVSFLGPSGCGKTTTLRMVAGLEENSHGLISFTHTLAPGQSEKDCAEREIGRGPETVVSDAEKGHFLPPEKRKVGMVFQSYAVWPHMNVFDNIAYPLKLKKKSRADIQKAVEAVLAIVEMTGLEKRMPHEISGGQQQRVALARGLVMEPRILLLDEPLSNLDAKLREKMRRDIRRIQQQLKLTVIYVTHDQREAFQMSDRVVVMNKGRIEQVGTPAEIQGQAATPFVREFIEAGH